MLPKEETSVPGPEARPWSNPNTSQAETGLVALGSAQERKRNALKSPRKVIAWRAADAMNKADAKKKDQQGPQ